MNRGEERTELGIGYIQAGHTNEDSEELEKYDSSKFDNKILVSTPRYKIV